MLIIFTGNGKGKTTAALGLAMRAVGGKSTVLMIQFIKGPWLSGEHNSAKKLAPEFKIIKKGKGFVGIGDDKLPLKEHILAAEDGLECAKKEALTNKWNIIILDEIWNALALKLLSNTEINKLIAEMKPHVDHIIMTGRSCTKEFIDMADIVTEMKEIKHPFKNGVAAVKGIEF